MQTVRKLTTVASLIIATLLAVAPVALAQQPTNTFVVAAYNVENWLLMRREGKDNQPKPQAEKDYVWSVLASVRPDVLGLEEMGTAKDLDELLDGLRMQGLEYSHHEWIEGGDPTRHVALVSRFPITRRFSRTDYTYLLNDAPRRIERGILDVEVQVNDQYSLRALVAHLKSKRQSSIGDQAMMRLEEARLLRSHIGKALKDNPQLNLIAMGDFNDMPDSEPIRTIIGEPPFALLDLMPVDSKGGRGTHYWEARDSFSCIDYMVVGPGLSNEYVAGSARIADVTGWEYASDHRAIYASFLAHDVGESATEGDTTAATRDSTTTAYIMVAIGLVVVIVIVVIMVRRQRPAPKT